MQMIIQLHEKLKVGKSPMLDSWPLFGSPVPVTLILGSYITFVLYLGPRWMKNRQPFNLKYVIILYNALQVYHNYWMISTAVSDKHYFKFLFGMGCANVSPKVYYDFEHFKTPRAFWNGTMNKLLDLLDTIFFVLTKKQSHVTFLHVHHHVMMVAVVWIFGKYFTGQEPAFAGFININIHMVMYTYYLISALGPKYKKYLWWKRYLTLMQMGQFVIIMIWMTLSLWLSCDYNPYITMFVILEAGINLGLFTNFYLKSYKKKHRLHDQLQICGSLQFGHEDKPQNCDENGNIIKVDELKRKMD